METHSREREPNDPWWARLRRDQSGAIMIEYVLLLLAIAVPLSALVKPLMDAVYWFMTNVYLQVSMP